MILQLLGLVALFGSCLGLAFPAQAPVTKPAHPSAIVDLGLTGRLTDKTIRQTVEWYHVGPLPPAAPNNPPRYVRGVRVREDGAGSAILAHWEARPTTILAFYPKLNGLWGVSGAARTLVSVAVQYGGRVVDLYLLRLERGIFTTVGHMEGESMSIMRLNGHLVVEVMPDDYYKVPSLQAWNGSEFVEASRDFPQFYAKLGKDYVGGVRNPHPLPAEAIVASCQLALQAYDLAGRPAVGREACLDARRRISSGLGLIPGLAGESPQHFEQERAFAVKRIDTLIRATVPHD